MENHIIKHTPDSNNSSICEKNNQEIAVNKTDTNSVDGSEYSSSDNVPDDSSRESSNLRSYRTNENNSLLALPKLQCSPSEKQASVAEELAKLPPPPPLIMAPSFYAKQRLNLNKLKERYHSTSFHSQSNKFKSQERLSTVSHHVSVPVVPQRQNINQDHEFTASPPTKRFQSYPTTLPLRSPSPMTNGPTYFNRPQTPMTALDLSLRITMSHDQIEKQQEHQLTDDDVIEIKTEDGSPSPLRLYRRPGRSETQTVKTTVNSTISQEIEQQTRMMSTRGCQQLSIKDSISAIAKSTMESFLPLRKRKLISTLE